MKTLYLCICLVLIAISITLATLLGTGAISVRDNAPVALIATTGALLTFLVGSVRGIVVYYQYPRHQLSDDVTRHLVD